MADCHGGHRNIQVIVYDVIAVDPVIATFGGWFSF